MKNNTDFTRSIIFRSFSVYLKNKSIVHQLPISFIKHLTGTNRCVLKMALTLPVQPLYVNHT